MTTTLDQFHYEIQEFVGSIIQFSTEDRQVIDWLFTQPADTYSHIKANCPFRLPRMWREWYENGVMPI